MITILALAASGVGSKAATAQIYTVAEAAKQIDKLLDDMAKIQPDDATATNSCQELLVSVLDVMRQKSVMLVGDRKSRWEGVNAQLEIELRNWRKTSTAEHRSESLARLRKTWAALKQQFPPEALQVLPRLWSCSMHAEILESSPGVCPICGMSLEPVYLTQPQLTSDPIIHAEIIALGPLLAGRRADLRIRLTFTEDKAPVNPADLEETHTRKIHLLITEPTETDYHHEHPEALGNGVYGFSFNSGAPRNLPRLGGSEAAKDARAAVLDCRHPCKHPCRSIGARRTRKPTC